MSRGLERIVARGFERRIEADIIRRRFETSAITRRTKFTYFVRRMDGRWNVYERRSHA